MVYRAPVQIFNFTKRIASDYKTLPLLAFNFGTQAMQWNQHSTHNDDKAASKSRLCTVPSS
eukprot:1529529-Amphidinium_carterae.1